MMMKNQIELYKYNKDEREYRHHKWTFNTKRMVDQKDITRSDQNVTKTSWGKVKYVTLSAGQGCYLLLTSSVYKSDVPWRYFPFFTILL